MAEEIVSIEDKRKFVAGLYALTKSPHFVPLEVITEAVKILEDQEQALVRDYNAFDRQIAREKGEALEDYNQRKEELTGTYFKLMVDNSVGTLDPKQIEKEKTAAQRRFQKSQNYLLQDQENRVVGFRDKTFPQMIDFIVAGGFQSGGPDTDPATTAKISSSTKGISVVAEALAGKSGVEIPALQTPLTKEQYEEWVERSKDGEGVEYLNSFSLGSDAVPPELFKRLGIPSDSAEGIAVMDVLDGAMRENLQKQALKQRYEEYDTLLDRAKSQKQDPKELARIRALSNSMAGTSLAEAGITRESVLNQHLDTLGEDPRLQVGFTDKDLKTQDNRTLAMRAAVATKRSDIDAYVSAAQDLADAGIDSRGQPIRSRSRSDDPMKSNPFIQVVVDKLAEADTLMETPGFYAAANRLGMNLAEGERPTLGQMNRIIRATKRDRRRPYQATKNFIEVDVVDRDRALEISDGQFVSFVDEETGDFITKDAMQKRSEAALADEESNPVVEFNLDDKGTRELMGMALDSASADKVRQLNKLYSTSPKKAAGSSVLFNRRTNEVAIIGPDRLVFALGTLDKDQVVAINEAARNSNVAEVASDPAGVKEGTFNTSLQNLKGLSIGTRYDGNLYAPPGTKLSMETPVRTVRGFVAPQKLLGDQSKFVVMGGDRQGEQISFSDVRGDMVSSDNLPAEELAKRLGLEGAKAARFIRRSKREAERTRRKGASEFRKGRGTFESEAVKRKPTDLQRALKPTPEKAAPSEEAAATPAPPTEMPAPETAKDAAPTTTPPAAAPVTPPPAAVSEPAAAPEPVTPPTPPTPAPDAPKEDASKLIAQSKALGKPDDQILVDTSGGVNYAAAFSGADKPRVELDTIEIEGEIPKEEEDENLPREKGKQTPTRRKKPGASPRS